MQPIQTLSLSQQLSHSYSTSQLIHAFSQLNLPPLLTHVCTQRACTYMYARTHTSTKLNWHAPSHTPTHTPPLSLYRPIHTVLNEAGFPSSLSAHTSRHNQDLRSPQAWNRFEREKKKTAIYPHPNSHACVPLNLHTPRNVHTTCAPARAPTHPCRTSKKLIKNQSS